ncbi:MAG TPA: adenosylhomocysteinase [Solirubrobacterales bacterium]|jgi:adenosylhomocysteinase|nr:adenosylhomocysteinase [Solirubrobacterales bacterium]
MATDTTKYDIADISLAEAGQARIDWADNEMPVLAKIRERFERERPLDGIRVGACLHVTTETANLMRTLIAGGAEVALCASNPLSTQDETAAALVDRYGCAVFAIHGESTETYYRHIDAVCDAHPHVTMDDGADVISTLHSRRREQIPEIIGGTEETTTGVIRLKALEQEGRLEYPIIAVNEAETKHLFDNRYGTGQSTIDGILRATNILMAGRVVAVIGYGWCGKGVGMRAKGMGAHVIVCEVDPLRALEAVMDGFEVLPGIEAAAKANVMVSVTGNRDAIAGEMFDVMQDGTIICNAGHFDVEINKGDLEAITAERQEVRPSVERFLTNDGRKIYMLADGRLVNLASAEGHPASVMDMSFANQALAAEHLVKHGAGLDNRVYIVPEEIDKEIARLKLEALRVHIDTLTQSQQRYLTSWDQGT